METIRIKLGYYNTFVVDSMGKSGSLALLWGVDVEAEIQNFSQRHINVIIHMPNQ
jgi:hypothetical protein